MKCYGAAKLPTVFLYLYTHPQSTLTTVTKPWSIAMQVINEAVESTELQARRCPSAAL